MCNSDQKQKKTTLPNVLLSLQLLDHVVIQKDKTWVVVVSVGMLTQGCLHLDQSASVLKALIHDCEALSFFSALL